MRNRLIIILLLLIAYQASYSQVKARLEFPYKDNVHDYCVIPMEEKGVLIATLSEDVTDGKRMLKTEHYDTNLKLRSYDSTRVDRSLEFREYVYQNGSCYAILRKVGHTLWGPKMVRGGEFTVVSYNPEKHKTEILNGEIPHNGTMDELVVGDHVMVFTSLMKNLDHIGLTDLSTGETKIIVPEIKGCKRRSLYILENTVTDDEICSLVRTKKDVYLVRFNKQGVQNSCVNLTSDVSQRLLTASISKKGNCYLLTGTYTNHKKKGEAQGIYFAKIEGDRIAFVRLYNFLDMENFTSFMSNRGQKKVERKKERAERRGKELSMNSLMASHEIKEYNGNYYYVGEAYYPTYTTTSTGFSTTTVFNGYQYTHALLAKFDAEGKLLWDNCFPMDPRRKPMRVIRFVATEFDGDNVTALYPDRKMLVSKQFRNTDGQVVQDRQKEVMETDNEEEDVKKAKDTETAYWYGDNFIVHGTQIVKNNQTGERRKVIFINKYSMK